MTSAQRRIWFAEQFRDVGGTYNLDASMRLYGPLDAAALGTAVTLLADRHPMLRLRVSAGPDGAPVQRIVPDPVVLRRIRATGPTPHERRLDAAALLRAEVARPLPVDGGPLFAPVLITVDPQEHVLALPYHHLAGDGESHRVLRSDLMALYQAVSTSTPPELPPPGQPYLEAVLAEASDEARDARAAALQQALSRLAGAPMESTVLADRPRPTRTRPTAHCVRVDLDENLTASIAAVAQARRVTPFIVHSAALHLLLQRYSGQAETLVGFMTANRTRDQRRTIGLYAQTVVQRLSCTDDPTVEQLLRRLRGDILAADEQRHAPLEDLVEALGQAGVADRHPLFQAMVNVVDPGPDLTVADLAAVPEAEPVALAWLDLELRLYPRPDGSMEGYLRAPADLYDRATVGRLARHFRALVEAVVTADPGARAATLPMLDPGDRAEVLAAGQGSDRPVPGTLTGLLRAALRRNPERVALTFEGRSLTYRELDERAHVLAGRLAARGIGPGSLVAVSAPRGVELVVALVGVVVAGAAYLPLDPDEPAARRAFMLADVRPAALLGNDPVDAGSTPAYDIGELSRGAGPGARALDDPRPDDLAYVLYTSGSTGAPKAAANTQLGIVNRLAWMQEEHQLDATDSVVQKTPFTFDVSVWEFFWPLLTGARLVVARPGGHRDPAYLAGLIRAERVTTAHFVPSMLRAFIAAGELSGSLPLRRVICSGEALPPQVADAFLAASPAELHNLYGPTEAAIDVTRHRCVAGAQVVPIGRAVPNTSLLVLDAAGAPAPFGGVGELHLGGVQLARGYVNRPDLTAERFIADPLRAGQRLYRTGDLARMGPDGVVEYLGRTDRQVKLRGLRIELGEVEAAIEEVDGVARAAVDVLGGAAALVAFVVAHDPALTREALVAALAVRLPAHLLPSRIHLLPELPFSRNGKLDFAALLAVDADAAAPAAPALEPVTPVEARLLDLVRDIVGRETVAVTDSFFAVGGDSIRSIELVARARAEGLEVTVEDIFTHPSIRQLAIVAGTGRQPQDGPGTAPFALLEDGVRRGLPAGVVDAFPLSTTLAGLLVESTQPRRYRVYTTSLRLRGDLDVPGLERALASVLRRHPFLRSAVVPGPGGETAAPLQVVHGEVPVTVTILDLADRPRRQRDEQVRAWLETEATVPFEWSRPPLLRVTVHRLADDEFQLTLAEPYLDGFSAALVLTELLDAYQRRRPDGPDHEVRGYADYLAEQRTATARSAGFWRDQLADAPNSQVFGLDADVDEPVLAHVDVDFPTDVSTALTALNRATGVPLKSILLAAHVRAVAVATAQAEVVTGLMANARPATADGSSVVGLFLNANPLRVSLRPGTWWQLVKQVQQTEAATLPHRAYPFAQLRRDRLADGVGTLFNFTHFHPYDRVARGGRLQVLERLANDQTYFPLTAQFQLDPLRQTLALRLEFFGADLTEAGRDAVAALYRSAVTELARAPHGRHDTAALAAGPDPEHCSVLGGAPAAAPAALHDTFAARAAQHPDRLAVRGRDGSWTFAELADRAARVAGALRERGVAPGEPVGVCLHREPWLVAAILGTLQAGAVYLPLDPALPPARRAAMVESAGCRVVLAGPRSRELVPDDRVLMVPDTGPAPAPVPADPPDPEHPAYLIFTSGSTGTPKGVLVSHRAVANRLAWGRQDAPFSTDDVLSARTPIAFVDSVAELLAGPLAGATTDLVPDSVQDPAALVDHLAAAGATRVTSVPTLLAEVLRLDTDLAGRLHRLRHWTVSGEALPTDLAHLARRRFPGVRVLNLYGSTEVAADATGYVVRGDEQGPTIPIGRPIDGGGARVTDPWGNPVPRLVAGRLVVTGAPVGAGYLGGAGPGGFLVPPGGGAPTAFDTGDLVRVDARGDLEYLGRADRQLKIRGVRLDPAEIETVLRAVAGVSAAVVVADRSASSPTCTAYLVPESPAAAPQPRQLRRELRRRLPAAAIPDGFAVLDRLPLTVTGKVDRRALAELSRPLGGAAAGATPPRTLVERELAGLWQAQLGGDGDPVGREDDFFDIGGHSLLALLLIAAVRERMGVGLSMTDVFDHPTLADQAELIEDRLIAADAPASPQHSSRPTDGRDH